MKVFLHNVEIALKNLNANKASRIGQISVRFLTEGAPEVAPDLVYLIKMSIKLDTFPSNCKISKNKSFV